LVPSVRLQGMRSAAVFEDAQTHDSRLLLPTVAGAARAGVVVLNYAQVTALERGSAEVQAGGRLEVRFKHCVNAAGPWVDHVRRLEDPSCSNVMRLTKGAHLLMPGMPLACRPGRAAGWGPGLLRRAVDARLQALRSAREWQAWRVRVCRASCAAG
jgi:glycerol-3-phosphate dehydrogenase